MRIVTASPWLVGNTSNQHTRRERKGHTRDVLEQRGYSRDRTLWLNVIASAIEDYYIGRRRPAYKYRIVRGYFFSADFAWVCGMAHVDPARVRGNLTRIGDVVN